MIAVSNILWELDTPKEPNKRLDNLLFERPRNILVHLLSNNNYHLSFTVQVSIKTHLLMILMLFQREKISTPSSCQLKTVTTELNSP